MRANHVINVANSAAILCLIIAYLDAECVFNILEEVNCPPFGVQIQSVRHPVTMPRVNALGNAV